MTLGFSCNVWLHVLKLAKCCVLLRATLKYKKRDIILPLYKSLIRPYLEYAVKFLSLNFRKEIDKIDSIFHNEILQT